MLHKILLTLLVFIFAAGVADVVIEQRSIGHRLMKIEESQSMLAEAAIQANKNMDALLSILERDKSGDKVGKHAKKKRTKRHPR